MILIAIRFGSSSSIMFLTLTLKTNQLEANCLLVQILMKSTVYNIHPHEKN